MEHHLKNGGKQLQNPTDLAQDGCASFRPMLSLHMSPKIKLNVKGKKCANFCYRPTRDLQTFRRMGIGFCRHKIWRQYDKKNLAAVQSLLLIHRAFLCLKLVYNFPSPFECLSSLLVLASRSIP